MVDDVWAALETATAVAIKEWAQALGRNEGAPVEILIEMLDLPVKGPFCLNFLYRRDLPAAVRDAAVSHPNRKVRLIAAEAGNLTLNQWDRLLATFEKDSVHAALVDLRNEPPAWHEFGGPGQGIEPPPHPGALPPSTLTEIAEWAAAVPEPPAERTSYCPWWIAALHSDPDAMRQLAASPNSEIRRGVARARHLPPDVLDLLAHDEDRVVQLFLSESCDDTPAEVLVEVWGWWPGSFSFPGRPRNHPNFPTTDLLRYADDPRPRVRLLALSDPHSTADVVERFAGDPDSQVRREAAIDPRVSPATLVALLLDDSTASAAARNPALPAPVMRRMIQLARQAG